MEDRKPITSKLLAVGLSATIIVAGFVLYQSIDSKSGTSDFVIKLENKSDSFSDGDMVTKEVTSGARIGDTFVSPQLSPVLALSPSVSPSVSPLLSPTPSIAVMQLSPTVTVSVSPTPSVVLPTPATVTSTPSLSVSPVVTPTPALVPSPDYSTGHVVINEIAWMGTAANSTDEWIELYNFGSNAVDLTGWVFKSISGAKPDPVVILSGLIPAGGYYLLERTNDDTIYDIDADKIYTGAFSDDPAETLELRDNSGNLRDSVGNGGNKWLGGNKTTRSSMERISASESGNNTDNWATNNGQIINGNDANGNPIKGTPKAKNSVQI